MSNLSSWFRWLNTQRERLYDWQHRVDTWQQVDLDKLNIASDNREHGVQYVPTTQFRFQRMMKNIPTCISPLTFVDLGCGKGKVLLLASNYPFRKIIGVEFSVELASVASRNCRAYRSIKQKCRDLSALCQDAAAYQLPPGPVVVYMFNPFKEPVMKSVLAEMRNCLERGRQDLYVIYFAPALGHLLKSSGFLDLIDEGPHFSIFKSKLFCAPS
jgi:SAM-dependent methyltransferase